jgi:hypothetical protein
MSSQIDSMSTSLTTLDTLKNNVADIQGKINDIENKNNQAVAQTVLTTTQLALVLDKSTYVPGDTIKLTAIGINPQKSVQVELLDNSDFILIHKETWSDSSGKLNYDLQLSNSLLQGNYKVQIVSDQQTQSQPITIAAQSSTQTVTGSSTFTAQTDKTVYSTGDLIQVTGVGPTGSSVSGIMTSPSGKTYSTATTIQADGSYVMIFSPSQPYETGQWNVSITNLGQTKTIPFSIGTGSSTGFYAFTAQTDKTVYQRGSLVQVTGTGQVSTSVTATMTSPSGKTYSTATTIRSDGTFSLVFSTLSADETGQWNISVANLAQAKTISVYLQ